MKIVLTIFEKILLILSRMSQKICNLKLSESSVFKSIAKMFEKICVWNDWKFPQKYCVQISKMIWYWKSFINICTIPSISEKYLNIFWKSIKTQFVYFEKGIKYRNIDNGNKFWEYLKVFRIPNILEQLSDNV